VHDTDEVNLVSQIGCEVYLGEDPGEEGRKIFTGARFVRVGDLRSVGYDGELPYGIDFADGMAEVVAKVGRAADFHEADENDRCEFLHWNEPDFRLHVLFDQDDRCASRVTVLGCAPLFLEWDDPFAP
jgi:hypothetical protein